MSRSAFISGRGDGLQIRWANGHVELFSESEFVERCTNVRRRTDLFNAGQRLCSEDYKLTVMKTVAFMDFGGEFEERNLAADRKLDIGITRIEFIDDSRSDVRRVEFKYKGHPSFRSYRARWNWQHSQSTFVIPKGDQRVRATVKAVLRPGQMRFRARLLNAYGHTCCATGCVIANTLEAAHILNFEGDDFDHIQNGLLFRADLHRLMDSGLLGINPNTFSVQLKPKALADPTYALLQGHVLNKPTHKAHAPSAKALRRHWKRFLARSG